MPSIDVAIPCYQYGRFLRACVRSVLDQKVDGLRVLIIDNASTDNSAEVARAIAAEDSRVEVVVHPRNLGPHASYNEGVEWASGDYFLLLDADDLLAPGALSRAVRFLEANPNVCAAHGTQAFLHPDNTVHIVGQNPSAARWEVSRGEDFIRAVCRQATNPVGAPTMVRRTAAQKKAGYYRPALPYCDDLELWLRLALQGDVARTTAVQAIRRIHDGQHGQSFQAVLVRDFRERRAAFESFFDHEGAALTEADALRALARRGLAEHAYWSALSHLARRKGHGGMELLRYALGLDRRLAVLPPLGWLARDDRTRDRLVQVFGEFLLRRENMHGTRIVTQRDLVRVLGDE